MNLYRSNRQVVGHAVNGFVGLAELLLLVRVVVEFFFTHAGGSFFHWVRYTTDTLVTPLRGIFTNPTHVPGSWYVDWPALLAMALYAALGYMLISLAARLAPDTTARGNRR